MLERESNAEQMTIISRNHESINPRFRNLNRLFVQSLNADENDLTRNYFAKYYM